MLNVEMKRHLRSKFSINYEFYISVGSLMKMIQGGHPMSFDIIIRTLDLYRYNPCELPGFAYDAGERQWFFFVPRYHKNSSAQPNRLTKSGYLKATGSDRVIHNEQMQLQCIDLKKILVFCEGGQRKIVDEAIDYIKT